MNEYMLEVDEEYYAKMELLVEQMKAGAGIMEELKAIDQMKWVGLMSNIRSSQRKFTRKTDICIVLVRSVVFLTLKFIMRNNFCYAIISIK